MNDRMRQSLLHRALARKIGDASQAPGYERRMRLLELCWRRQTGPELAKQLGYSPASIQSVSRQASDLVEEGLLDSARGVGGGYLLTALGREYLAERGITVPEKAS